MRVRNFHGSSKLHAAAAAAARKYTDVDIDVDIDPPSFYRLNTEILPKAFSRMLSLKEFWAPLFSTRLIADM